MGVSKETEQGKLENICNRRNEKRMHTSIKFSEIWTKSVL